MLAEKLARIFLRNDKNKSELFSILSLQMEKLETEKQIIVTRHTNGICTQPRVII